MHGQLLSDQDRVGAVAPRAATRPAGGGVAGMMTALQSSAGNSAVQRAIAAGGLSIQREGCGGGSCGCATCGPGGKTSDEEGGAAGPTEA